MLEIKRVERVYTMHSERFVERILTENEKKELLQRTNKANYLAKQFAAKEAIAKSFGTGIGQLSFKDIEILRSDKGQPIARILTSAANEFRQGNLHISLSDTKSHVTAFAVYELG